MIQWEYKVAPFHGELGSDNEFEFIITHGHLGWELCYIYNRTLYNHLYYFKRQITQPDEQEKSKV